MASALVVKHRSSGINPLVAACYRMQHVTHAVHESIKSLVPNYFIAALCFTGVLFFSHFGRLELAIAEDQTKPAPSGPLSPAESLRQFRLAPGLRIELVAAEPEVIDPVALRFDELGQMWVVEMRDYPHGPSEGQKPQSKIRVLTDRDGDGRYETARTFAEGLLFVTGLQPWKGGVIVTLAGRVAYMKDTNGDGRADVDETWFTGFAEQNSQLRANHPRFGLDNHIYVANGLRGGAVSDARRSGGKPISISGMDFRFDPLGSSYEAVTGVGQFGLTFDDFGNRFVCSNRNPLKHIVLEDLYLKRNPLLAVPAAFHDVAAAGESSRVFAISRAWTTSNLHAGQFTAACGVDLYRGDALPRAFYGNSFTCEPTGNLVHREVLRPKGATFDSRPGREGVEFLASPDEWFRPVNINGGPDGALYVLDMYRAVIEHPQFMPQELKERPDLRLGDDRGRIWRIVPADFQRSGETPSLTRAKTADLVPLLEHSNAWWRETAARLLHQRQDTSVISALEKMAEQGKSPAARAQAFWSLAGLNSLKPEIVAGARRDEHPRVREQAWKLTMLAMRTLDDSMAVLNEPDARVRFQAALALGATGDTSTELLARLAIHDAADPWMRYAVETAAPDSASGILQAVLEIIRSKKTPPSDGELALTEELAAQVGARRKPEEIAGVLDRLSGNKSDQPLSARVAHSVMIGMARAAARRGTKLTSLVAQLPDSQSEARSIATRQFARAAELAADGSQTDNARRQAIELLAYADYSVAGPVLTRLIERDASQQVRVEAIDALAAHRDPRIATLLLADFQTKTPAIRSAVLSAVVGPRDRINALLDEIEAGRIKPAELGQLHTGRLVKHSDASIRNRATKLLADFLPADRKKVLADYQVSLRLKSDPIQGREVFRKQCSACHRIAGIGVDVAPNISDSRTKQPSQILTDILQPNRAIDNNYISYTVTTVDGRALTGIVTSETGSSITLRQPENKTVSLLRTDIDEMQSSGVSLMPEGLEKNIDPQQMADLIAFIKNWRYLDGRTPTAVGGAGKSP